jgi:dipeptidyl aminopeptidase/acylaminoacyl peptidase
LYFIAEHQGSILPYHLAHPDRLPTPLLFKHATGSITPLTKTSLLLSINSLTSPSDDFILDLDPAVFLGGVEDGDEDKVPNRSLRRLTSWSEKHIAGRLDGLEIESLWFKGADEWDVMAWVVKPSNKTSHFTRSHDDKLPLAFFVHGGPQGSWEDAWSTRWNPALFAANGYFVVAVNPTGSTGYGQEFCDKIKQDWGGAPFKDLLAGHQAALEQYPEVGV